MHPSCRSRLRSLICAVLSCSTPLLAQTPPPTITGFSPTTISIGMPVTITGTNFVSNNTTVRFGNATATSTTVQSSTQLTAVVPTSLANAPGNITVASSGGNATSPTSYTVNLAPIITSFTPTTAPVNRMVTVSGYNFLGSVIANRTISVNGANVTTSLTAGAGNQITFPIPANATTGRITVSTSQGVAVSASNIVIGSGPAPANDSFATPTVISGPTGNVTASNTYATKEPAEPNHGGNAGGASIWFSWTAPASRWYLFNPNQTTTTNFGVLQSISTGNDLSSITVLASASSNSAFPRYSSAVPLNATAGTTYRIALDGFNGVNGDVRLNWSELNAPQIASFAPSTPPTVFAGQIGNITVGGSGFTPSSSVSIGGVTLSPARVSVATPTTLSFTQVPLNAALGASPVTITTPVGTATSPTTLEIIAPPAPTITTFSPANGNIGANVTITGIALALADSPVSVLFNGIPAAGNVTVSSSNSITARVPTGATTGPITITTPAGTMTSSANFTVGAPVPPPTISSFTPGSGFVGQGVQVTGQNFANVTSVSFNGVPATSFIVDSLTQVTAYVPSGATTGPITVTTTTGSATSEGSFVVNIPALISSFSPTTLSTNMRVIITGSGFSGVVGVAFNGLQTGFTIDSDTQITSALPPGATPGQISLITPTGTYYSPTPYTIAAPEVPVISGFSPGAIAPGQTISISGAGFSGVTAVRFNGILGSYTVISPTLIEARAPTTGFTAGFITVATSLGTATSPAPYTISLAPIITGITPSTGPIGRVITVNGSNFSGTGISSQILLVNGTPIAGFSRGATTWTFAVPAGATTGPITIQTSQGFATSPIPFTVASGPAPANDAFASPLALTGASGVLLGNTANATKEPGEPNHANNPGGASVWFTWTAPSSGLYLFNPSNSASSQIGIIQSIYTGDTLDSLVRVATGATPTGVSIRYLSAAVLDAIAGTTYRIALDGFNGVMADYRLSWAPLAPPTISTFSPTSGTAGQTTPSININGANFTPGATVSFNGAVATAVTYQNPNLITVTQLPLGATTGPITITTPAGSATSTGNFTVATPTPVISSFSPSGAKVGTPVQINGTNFANTLAVLFNGTAASSFTVTGNNTVISTAVPPGASTGPITVVTPLGSGSSAQPFTVIVPPVITEHPQSQTVPAFTNVVLSVTAQSNGPEEYYWTKNGIAIFGADTRTLTLNNVTAADAGAYAAVVVNNAGSVTSAPAVLTVTKVPATLTLGDLATTYDGTPRPVSATTSPAGLAVVITYDGSPSAPTNAGTYAVSASISDLNYGGTATGFLHIAQATATIEFAALAHTYDGLPKNATVTTTPPGLAVSVAYPGGVAPIDAGSYPLTATVADPNYLGTRAAFLTINPATASIALAGLVQRYDGAPRTVTATTTPANLPVVIVYNGSGAAPTYPGAYAINASIDHPNYTGTASGTLNVGTTVRVRHAPTLNGDVFGSIHVLSPESITFNGSSLVSGDLLVPGTPDVRLNGHPTYASTIDASGAAAPSDHVITLNGNAVLRHVVRRINALALPVVTPPAPPLGTIDVVLSSAPPAIDYSTLRDLTLDVNGSTLAVAPGAYRHFTVNHGNTLILGNTGATVPDRYDLQQLTLNGNSRIRLAGPVILNVANTLNNNGTINDDAPASWLTLQVASGGLTLNSNTSLSGHVVAPNGTVTLNSATLEGSVSADQLIVNSNATLTDPVD